MIDDTDLLGDTDDLRSLLRSRAALAPHPDDLIPATRPLARRRRQRRRGALFGGVVVLTVLALIGATMLRSVEASVTPSGPPLVPPVFPFSVGPLPDGLVLERWTSLGGDIPRNAFTLDTMNFSGPDTHVIVEWTNYDPALTVTPQSVPRTTVTVHGVAGVAVGLNGQLSSVSWPAGPLRWINVATDSPHAVPEPTLLAIAAAVTARPSSPPTTFDIAHLPPGLRAVSWQHDQQGGVIDDSVELCPPTAHNSRLIMTS